MTEKAFTLRSLIIGLIFGSLVAVANAFLMLTIPVMITAAMVSVIALVAYASFFRQDPPSSKEAVTAYTAHKAAAFAFSIFPIVWIFLVAYEIPKRVGMGIPDWILPDSTLYGEVLWEGKILSRVWITPLAWMLPVAIVSGIGALMVVIWLRGHLVKKEELVFPEAQADIQLIKSLNTEKYRLDYLFYGLIIGFFFDFLLIHYPASLGWAPTWLREISARIDLLDFTPYVTKVLPGATFCIVVSMGILGLGMLMSSKSTFNMAGSAVLFYMVVSSFLVGRGTIQAFESFSSQWPAFRYPYGLSLSVGLLVTAACAPLILKIASPLISGTKWKWKPPRKTLTVFAVFCVAVFLLFMILSMDRFVTVFPLSAREALLAGIVVLGVFVLGILINTRIAGESGIVWMAQLADITDYIRRSLLTTLGAVGFEAFAISESLRGTRFAAGQMEALKVGEAFKANPKHQYLSALFGWCFGWLISTPFVFLLWNFYGFGRGALPMPNMQGIASVITAFSTGMMGEVFNNWFILMGFIIGIVVFFLEKRSFPFVATAFGIGVFVGPIYVTTFFLGGLIRVFIEKRKGVTWMDEKGKPLSAGLVLGGLALAPLLMVVVNVLILALGGG
ncbi:MAG: OPT/YSL family transporter [Theionarchaea archaeon]|nr:MAG: hypothetical protein AYK19_02565 [Theionarchaea archaeon DG-70-1]MBU7027108.1 OPT/YSL family transporter [Theionarchaea archaeon]